MFGQEKIKKVGAAAQARGTYEFRIVETYTSKNSLSEPQHSVSAPAHSLVIEPMVATSPQNGASSPVVESYDELIGTN